MPTGALCCCFLPFRCCCCCSHHPLPAHLPRYAVPCQTLPSLLHPVMDPVFFCVFLPFPRPCLVSANSYAKNAAHRSFICDKGKKGQDAAAAAAAAVDEGSDAVHAPPCSKTKTKRKKASGRVLPCDAMRCVRAMWIPTNMPALTKREEKKAKRQCRLPGPVW